MTTHPASLYTAVEACSWIHWTLGPADIDIKHMDEARAAFDSQKPTETEWEFRFIIEYPLVPSNEQQRLGAEQNLEGSEETKK